MYSQCGCGISFAHAAWPDAPERLDVTLFPSSGPVCQEAARGAAELVALAHAAHAFTNTADFTLRCGVCQVCWNCLLWVYEMFCYEMFRRAGLHAALRRPPGGARCNYGPARSCSQNWLRFVQQEFYGKIPVL